MSPRAIAAEITTEAEITRQTLARFQGQLQQLTMAVQTIAAQQVQPPLPGNNDDEHDDQLEDDNPFAGAINNTAATHNKDWRWEQSFKFEIPEFHGGPTAEELLDWIATVEEILEFKHVPLERCVPMIAMKFRSRAAAWWTQIKASRIRLGKQKIMSSNKLKKKMHNFTI